jgi:hypothetical protein
MVRRRRGQAGWSLAMALFVVFVVTLALGLLGSSLVLRMRLVLFEVETVNLIALADGVLSESLGNLYVDGSFPGVAEHPLGNGRVKSEIRLLESLAPGERLYEVVATSTFHRRRRSVRAEVWRKEELRPGEDEGSGTGRVRLRVRHWERMREPGGERKASF